VLAAHKYGIHGMRAEPFGIAVAEMVNAGCIVFVPDDGGMVEIVGDCQELTYRTPSDAVAKIAAVVRDPERQRTLSRDLSARRVRFSTTRFMQQMRSVVDEFARHS
jgi:glycosyltransferase involved in cell wall biosynthesis